MKKMILILLAFCFTACTDNEIPTDTCGSVTPVVFSAYEPQCGYFLKKNPEKLSGLVINTQNTIDTFFEDSRAVVNCFAPSGPDFDLTKNTYLAVFAGPKPTGGYSIKIQSVIENDCGVLVEFYQKSPKADEVVTQATTYPVDYAVIAKTTKPVYFKEVAYGGDYIVIGSYSFFCPGTCPVFKYRIEAAETARFSQTSTGTETFQNLSFRENLSGFLAQVPQEIKDLKGQTKEYINPNVADGGGCYFEYHQEGVVTKIRFTNFDSTNPNDANLIAFKNYIYSRINYLNTVN